MLLNYDNHKLLQFNNNKTMANLLTHPFKMC